MAKFFCILISFLLLICLLAYAIKTDNEIPNDVFTPIDEAPVFSVTLEPFDEEVSISNPAIEEWQRGEYNALQLYDVFHREIGRLDYPTPVKIQFNVKGIPDGEEIISQMLEISENEGFESARMIEIDTHKSETRLFNLKASQNYYLRMTVISSSGKTAFASSSFTTADAPRFIFIDGIRNVRDVGNYKTLNGEKLKQGVLYRGTELNDGEDVLITEKGYSTLINDLGVRTELDLRGEEERIAPLSDDIEHKSYGFYHCYSDVFTESGMTRINRIFTDLANPELFPAYLHCDNGSDYTGTVIYLLLAALGVPEEDCYKEWELSAFAHGNLSEEEMNIFIEDIQALEGETLQDKASGFLLECGITPELLDSIRNILLEETPETN